MFCPKCKKKISKTIYICPYCKATIALDDVLDFLKDDDKFDKFIKEYEKFYETTRYKYNDK